MAWRKLYSEWCFATLHCSIYISTRSSIICTEVQTETIRLLSKMVSLSYPSFAAQFCDKITRIIEILWIWGGKKRDFYLSDSLKHSVVRVVGVADSVGPSEQHLERDIWDQSSQLLESLPRTFWQESHGHVKGSAYKDTHTRHRQKQGFIFYLQFHTSVSTLSSQP